MIVGKGEGETNVGFAERDATAESDAAGVTVRERVPRGDCVCVRAADAVAVADAVLERVAVVV